MLAITQFTHFRMDEVQIKQSERLRRPHRLAAPDGSEFGILKMADSTMCYAAPIWHEAINNQECCRLLRRVQRKSAIDVVRTFRTVRFETAVLLAGLLPICLAIKENTRVHSRCGTSINNAIRREERQRSREEWQATWDANAANERASR